MADRLAFLPRALQQYLAGNVSKMTLLTKLLPLSFMVLLVTLVISASHFPGGYDWTHEVISHLISPRYNPEGYLTSALGMAVAAFFALPFAGYVEQRLHGVAPHMSRWSGVALAVGIFLVMSVPIPLNVDWMPKSVRWMHEALARTAAGGIFGGMIGCCLCGLKDRLRGKQTLSRAMVASWVALTGFPIIGGILGGILKMARKADIEWAVQTRAHLKQTMVWQLAFWEWICVTALILFMLVSVVLLPERMNASRQSKSADQ